MADAFGRPSGWSVAAVAAALVAVIAVGGTQLPVQQPAAAGGQRTGLGSGLATVGVCDVGDRSADDGEVAADRPPASVDLVVGRPATRTASGTTGTLTATALGRPDADPRASVDQVGTGSTVTGVRGPLLLRGTGVAAVGAAAAVSTDTDQGVEQGLALAPCTAAATDQWFVGLSAGTDARSVLDLTNPDSTQAEVDLRFLGPRGELVVPGSPGVVVPARGSRTVSLAALFSTDEPVSVQVHATQGRVAALAQDLRTSNDDPQGVDWHPASVVPSTDVVVPAVPDGGGTQQRDRTLVVVNPNDSRTTVTVSVLGADGSFAPVGAEQLELAPFSTGTVDLGPGLAGSAAGVRLQSAAAISASVLSVGSRTDAAPDLAVAVASDPVLGFGVLPVGYLPDATATLVLSNPGTEVADVSVRVVGLDGVVVSSDAVPVAAGGSAVRQVRSSRPVYLALDVPTSGASQVYAGISFARGSGPVAALTGMAAVSPDIAARAPAVTSDPAVGR